LIFAEEGSVKFYERKYGQRSDSPVVDTAIGLLNRCGTSLRFPIRVLDVGCGSMALGQTFVKSLGAGATEREIDIEGWDVSEKGVQEALNHGLNASIRDITAPLRANESAVYDVILFFEVLEHLVDTDTAIRNIRALLKADGILILSTPNLASWYNRILLLFGNQPHCTEVSYAPVRFGNRIVHRLLGEQEGKTEVAAGHLRVFTWKALREFLDYFGFDILKAKGCANHPQDVVSRVICSISPGLSGDLCVVAIKKRTGRAEVGLHRDRSDTGTSRSPEEAAEVTDAVT
jgi:2-polyprenyl-3-methyl-5-hydroxy-6-metoxy-1,4-benzoquinol methylase